MLYFSWKNHVKNINIYPEVHSAMLLLDKWCDLMPEFYILGIWPEYLAGAPFNKHLWI